MQLKNIMSKDVVKIRPEEPVDVAARMLEHYNIGSLPVCTGDGKLCGVVTDRDVVIRCLAASRDPAQTTVRDVMTARVVTGNPEMDTCDAACLMGRQQIRRLPVVENGKLCGMVSLGDLAASGETNSEASNALAEISSSLSSR